MFWLLENHTAMAYIRVGGAYPRADEIDLVGLHVSDRHPHWGMGVGFMACSRSFDRVCFHRPWGWLTNNPSIVGSFDANRSCQRGQAYEQPLTLHLTTEALVYDLGDLTMTADWRCITDLFATRKHWIFLVQSSAMVLPTPLFHDYRGRTRFHCRSHVEDDGCGTCAKLRCCKGDWRSALMQQLLIFASARQLVAEKSGG